MIKRNKIGILKGLFQLVIFIIILVAIFYFGFNEGVSPTGYIIDTTPEFTWGKNCDKYNLILDNNLDFKSPLIDTKLGVKHYLLNKDLEIGTYYWRVDCYKEGVWSEGKTHSFGIKGIVSLSRVNNGVENSGNVKEKVSFFEEGKIIGNAILEVGEKIKEKGDEILAEEN